MKRYDIETSIGEDYEPVESSDGEYVYYADHLAALAHARKQTAELVEAVGESTTDMVVTMGNIRAEMSRDEATANRWEGVVEHLQKQVDLNRTALAQLKEQDDEAQ